MKEVTMEKIREMAGVPSGSALSLENCWMEHMDLRGLNLRALDFTLVSFRDVRFDGNDLSGISFNNALLDGCSMAGCDLRGCDLRKASMRRVNLTGADLRGADVRGAVLEDAVMTDLRVDERTRGYRMRCPETGAFIGWKKCLDDRIVMLLVPADSPRTSATNHTCRCRRAKVLKIENFDQTESYQEAWSLVDPDFCYRRGEWVEALNFNPDRWYDSTGGIHFWMERQEALRY